MAEARTPAAAGILSGDDMALLRRLDLVHRLPARGLYPGQRRSSHTARSPEFSDFRPYVVGDDVRQVDWRAYGRLEKLMVRLHVAEEESAVNVVVDTSPSMALGSPAKWPAARRLAAAVAMLGLAATDRVAVGALDPAGPRTPHLRLTGGAGRILAFLAGLQPTGAAGPAELARLGWLRPGLTVVVSDFLVEGDWGPALSALGQQRQEVLLWQVLAPDEEHPGLSGDVRLRDSESAQVRSITVTPRVLRDYHQALDDLRARLGQDAGSVGGRFLHSRSDDGLEASMHRAVAAGVVRRV